MSSDPDGDGLSTRKEIESGTDPFTSDQNIPDYKLNNYRIRYSPLADGQDCDYGRWEAQISRLQVAPTLDVRRMPASMSTMNHSVNDQVVLFSYRLTPQNSATPISEFFWGLSKVNVTPIPKAPV